MLLIYGDENVLTQDEREACYLESSKVAESFAEGGHYLGASPWQSVTTASSVRIRDGRALVTDGPFAETHEQLGGYFLIDAPDMDKAVELAQQIPGARWGTVEVRPIVELTTLPE